MHQHTAVIVDVPVTVCVCLFLLNQCNLQYFTVKHSKCSVRWAGSVSFWLLAPARGLQRLCVLGQRLYGNPCSIWPGSNRRVSSEVLLIWWHATFAPVSWGGHHKRPCWPAEIQVSSDISHCKDICLIDLFLLLHNCSHLPMKLAALCSPSDKASYSRLWL